MNLSPVCIKRLISEYKKILDDPIHNCCVYMDDNNMLEWFVLMYNMDGPYKNGQYILKILMSPKYPFAPPDFMMLTPSGRFINNQKLCFSNSGYHKDEWSPLWNMSTIIIGFMSMFLDNNTHGIGHINDQDHIKIKYANESVNYNNKYQMNIINHLLDIKKSIKDKLNNKKSIKNDIIKDENKNENDIIKNDIIKEDIKIDIIKNDIIKNDIIKNDIIKEDIKIDENKKNMILIKRLYRVMKNRLVIRKIKIEYTDKEIKINNIYREENLDKFIKERKK